MDKYAEAVEAAERKKANDAMPKIPELEELNIKLMDGLDLFEGPSYIKREE
jgi:hypothetical protein